MRDDRSVIAAQEHREQREEKFLQDQRRQAEEDRARRAREQLEAERQNAIQCARRARGRCVFCGAPLRAPVRLFGVVRHWRCRSFEE